MLGRHRLCAHRTCCQLLFLFFQKGNYVYIVNYSLDCMHFKSIHLVPAASSAKLYTFSCQPSLVYSSVKGHMIIMPMWCQQPKSLAQHPYVKVKMYGLSLGETDDEEADHTASKSGIERLKAGEHPQTQATSRISITVNFICHLEACSNR